MRELLNEILQHIESCNASVEQSIYTLWPQLVGRLTTEDKEDLAKRGLNAVVNGELSRLRYAGALPPNTASLRVSSATTVVEPVTVRVTMWERVRYETADGGTAPILNFLVVDWKSLDRKCRERARGEIRVSRFARKMVQTLQEHETDRTADLPGPVLAELAASAPWALD